MNQPTEATIVGASIEAGHDGLAEVAIAVRHPNGATQTMHLPYEAVADALDAAAVSDLDGLVGRPWTTLVTPTPKQQQQQQPQDPASQGAP